MTKFKTNEKLIMNNTAYMKNQQLLICVFTFNFDTIYNDNIRIVINCKKDTIVAYFNTITFFMGKFFAIVSSWVTGTRKDSVINLLSLWKWDIICFLYSFSSNNYFVVLRFSHFILNSSYGVNVHYIKLTMYRNGVCLVVNLIGLINQATTLLFIYSIFVSDLFGLGYNVLLWL